MKKMVLTALLGIFTLGALCAQDSVTVRQKKYSGWGDNSLNYNQQAEITNDKNFYQFNLLQGKPGKQGNMETFMHLSAPREQYGFGRAPINFLSFSVNGIASRKLQPKKEDFQTWKKDHSAGAALSFNFDGAKLLLDVYMKKGSPILWFTFRQPEKQLEPIQSLRINVSLVISRLLTKNRTTVWENAYQRHAQTALKKMEQRREFYTLEANDKYVIFSDKVLDGSDKEKGFGPSFLTFDFAGVKAAQLNLQNAWLNSIHFDLKPDFKEFTFGIWQKKDAVTNQEFLKLFEAEKETFL